MSKYILVTGGVCSGLGKDVVSASIGSLLECSGLTVAMVKCAPHINIDAATMNPYQHGEVYVTADGGETDLNLGSYERFTNVSLTSMNSVTVGQIYETVIKNERAGRYNGKTVQVIPHITDEIKRRIMFIGSQSQADVVVVEIGGTVGDIESIPFLEAARQLMRELGKENALSIHLTLVPTVTGGELKTKPTQHSVKAMQEMGIQPDILLCRTEDNLDDDLKRKIGLFCNIEKQSVFMAADVKKTVYELPGDLHKQGLAEVILKKLGFSDCKTDIKPWSDFITRFNHPRGKVRIGMLCKKNLIDDWYTSVSESLFYAAVSAYALELEIQKIDAEIVEMSADIEPFFKEVDAVIIPGNYGQRGFLGLLRTVQYVRENRIPYLGIDLGMQLMAIETARNLLGIEDADSTEFVQSSSYPVISLPEEQTGFVPAGHMRLGNEDIRIVKHSKLNSIYKSLEITERHRSKYSFNKKYTEDLNKSGLYVSAVAKSDELVEAFEWKDHPWGIGVQYHPEFVSRPTKPHPLFSSFIKVAFDRSKNHNAQSVK
ncbi:MAG: CTP synthase [Spirochaetales bacterium]